MDLSNLKTIKTKKKAKRIGRGIGSGKGGHTVGRGTKGQKARKGKKIAVGFEGGQVPLYKRLPQLGGFKSRKRVVSVRLLQLNRFDEGAEVTPELLIKEKIIKNRKFNNVKIVGGGELKKKLILKGFSYSKGSYESVKKSGSTIND
ncbi:MAG: 50S ribosomal protein L15 [Patescibacteria group bacterium]|nr:MAG: 50S ribosomal protein L15 [Patescibacteria group bacterium]